MLHPLRNDLLDGLAADLNVQRRLLPCGVLRRLIQEPGLRKFKPDTLDHALLLAAVYNKLAGCLRLDFPSETARDPAPARWRRQLKASPGRVVAHRLLLAPVRMPGPACVPIATYRFLSALPRAWVSKLLDWAPPVVSGGDAIQEPPAALQNVLAAFLAVQVIPHEPLTVRVLVAKTPARFSILDLAGFAGQVLEPLCRTHRDRIVCAAPSLELAQTLTGLKRAMVARIRQRAEQGRPS